MDRMREPIRLLLILSISVFMIEIAIMAALKFFDIQNGSVEALIDASILTIVLFPVLYFLVFRKLVLNNAVLMSAESRLLAAQTDLEQRVEERTQELVKANAGLGASLSQLEVKRREIEILGDMAKMFQACHDFEEAFRVAEYELRRLFPEHVGALYIMKASRNQLDRVMAWGDPAGFGESFAPEQCWALRFGRPHHFGFGAGAMTCAHVRSGGADAHLCLPITAYSETLGALCLQRPLGSAENAQAIESPSPERLQFCATVTESLALAIANLRLRETLRHQALRDPLTGLFNRRYLVDSLERELERADELGQSLCVVMFDIDFFKRFNDEFGHDAGDAVLSALGVLLQQRTRATDVIGRYGGEEFAVVMTDTDIDLALHRVEALREEIASLAVKHNGRSLGCVSISAGVSVFPRDGDSPTALFRTADAAMYEAKKAGRNRVSVASGNAPPSVADGRKRSNLDTAA